MHVLVVVLRVNQFNKIQSKRRHVKNKKLLLLKPWWTGYKVDQKYSACVQILGESVKAKAKAKAKANINNCFQS